jgi:predicted nucleotidyltransferase
MEDIRDRLGEYKYNFFINLQNYIDTELHFFGSIKRADFFRNASDIDIIVITDNIKSMLVKLQQYLNIDKNKIQKIYQQHSINDKGIITGYKIKYKNEENDINFDLLVYDEQFRKSVIQNINDINNLPFYMVFILYILKILYYKFKFISNTFYIYLKSFIFYSYFNKEIRYYNKEKTFVIMIDNFN